MLLTRPSGLSEKMISGSSKKKLQIDSEKLRWILLSNIYSQTKNTQIKRQMTSDKTICSIFNRGKNILLHDLESSQKPIQLMFAQSYGRILDYQILDSGYLIVLFEFGQVSQLSLLNDELSQEINSKKLFSQEVRNFCWSADRRVLVVNAGVLVKFFDVKGFVELKQRRLRFGVNLKTMHMLNCHSALVVLLMNGELNSVLSEFAGFKFDKTKCSDRLDFVVQKSYNVLEWIVRRKRNGESAADS